MSEDKDGQNQSQGEKGGTRGKIFFVGIICAVVIIALIAAVVYLLKTRKEPEAAAEPGQQAKRDVLVTEDNMDEVLDEFMKLPEEKSEDRYLVKMNTSWIFPDGKSPSSNAYVENSTENTHDVYFDVYLNGDENDVIYSSPVIPLGGHISDIELNRELDDGTYDCVVDYHLIDEQQNTLSTVKVALKIRVGEAKKLGEN
jgi:hypothetical protein